MLIILSLNYCSRSRVFSLEPAKLTEYAIRTNKLLAPGQTISEDLARIVGNFQFATWVEPLGRPLLSFIRLTITHDKPRGIVPLSTMGRVEMCVCLLLLHRNRGLRLCYIFDDIPL